MFYKFGIQIFFLLLLVTNLNSQIWEMIRTGEGVEVRESGKKVLFYQVAEKSKDGEYPRANYIHPLYGLNEEILTEDFPEDHYHHRGIFWAWHQVWMGEKRLGDGWLCENIYWDVKDVKTRENNNKSLTITSDVFWKSPFWLDENMIQKPFLKEGVAITIHPESDGKRILDFDIVLTALVDSLFIGGSEDDKGYGGFSVRVFMPDNVQFSGIDGVVEPQELAVDAGNWINITGTYMNQDPLSGIVIMNHKENPDMPQKWILRAKGSMQNPVFPGKIKYEILIDKPLKLRYCLVLHEKGVDMNDVEGIYKILQ